MYVKKTDSPANGKQLYIDGRRYRSIFEASIDTGLTYWYLSAKLTESKGAPCFIKKHEIVLESWIMQNLDWLVQKVENKQVNSEG